MYRNEVNVNIYTWGGEILAAVSIVIEKAISLKSDVTLFKTCLQLFSTFDHILVCGLCFELYVRNKFRVPGIDGNILL